MNYFRIIVFLLNRVIPMRILCFLFLFNYALGFSQSATFDYLPKNKDSVIVYIDAISDKKIRKFGDNYKKEIRENILDRKQRFIEKIKDSSFVFNAEINNYLNSILNEIYNSNQITDKQEFYFFLDKSQIPNAACYGNGIFTINLGLFNFVNSDDELAFIICHEIAHYILEHNDKSLLQYFETVNSKDIKKKIKKVEKQEYGKRKAYSELMEELNYNFLKRSQNVEIEADSLGFVLFKNTQYNVAASTSSLKNLELADKAVFNEKSNLSKHFNFENYPFKDSWLQKDETLFDLSKKSDDYIKDSDSISTHPAIPIRVDKLKAMISNSIPQKSENKSRLSAIKKIVAYISIKTFIDANKIDLALYQCLVMYNQQLIDKEMYVDIVSKLLKKTYELKEAHTFGRFVSPMYPFSDEVHLNEVKQFLHNLELKSVRKIGLNFCLFNENLIKETIDFKNTLQFFQNLNP